MMHARARLSKDHVASRTVMINEAVVPALHPAPWRVAQALAQPQVTALAIRLCRPPGPLPPPDKVLAFLESL